MIRRMRPADCDVIAAIEAQTFDSALDRGRLLNLLKMRVFFGIVDDLDDPDALNTPNIPNKLNNLVKLPNLAGYLLATMIAEEAEILSIAVSVDHQKCGRGAGLLGHFLAHTATQDVKTVLLEVAADNMPALMLYQSYGFAKFGRRTAYYKRPDGDCDAIMMKWLRDRGFFLTIFGSRR